MPKRDRAYFNGDSSSSSSEDDDDDEEEEEDYDEEEKEFNSDSEQQHKDEDDADETKEMSNKVVNTKKGLYTNKQRVLVVASRGITARHRHLLEDFKKLIPHHKKDNKLDSKGNIQMINEIAEMKSCNQILYLETRKRQDLYLFLGKAPQGPSAKFQVVNIHTMDELKLTGNAMLGSRPLLNFDKAFDSTPHMKLLKQLLNDAFGTPSGHPKSKPFVDRIMSFFIVNRNIWIRNYQIVDKNERVDDRDTHLIEIGPRLVLVPIRIFSGSFGGATLYQNPTYVTPNHQRAEMKRGKGDRYKARVEHKVTKKNYDEENKLPPNILSVKNVFSK